MDSGEDSDQYWLGGIITGAGIVPFVVSVAECATDARATRSITCRMTAER